MLFCRSEEASKTDSRSSEDSKNRGTGSHSTNSAVTTGLTSRRRKSARTSHVSSTNRLRSASCRSSTSRASCSSSSSSSSSSASRRRRSSSSSRAGTTDGRTADNGKLSVVGSGAVLRDVDLVGVRLQALILHVRGSESTVVAGVPRAGDGKDKATALSAVRTWPTVTFTSIASVGDGRSSTDSVGYVRVVVGHEIDLDSALGRIDPVDSDLCTWFPVDGALVEVARRLFDDEHRVGVLVLSCLETLEGRSDDESGCSEHSSGRSQSLCERSHDGVGCKRMCVWKRRKKMQRASSSMKGEGDGRRRRAEKGTAEVMGIETVVGDD